MFASGGLAVEIRNCPPWGMALRALSARVHEHEGKLFGVDEDVLDGFVEL